jgi:L-iditol 2-dehydrogenase
LNQASARVFGGEGFDLAFECVGVEATITSAIEAIQKGGTLVVVGVFAEKPRVDIGLVQDRELVLAGTLMYQRRDYEQAIALIESGAIATEPLMSRHFAMADFQEAYRFLETQRDEVMKIFIDIA